MSKPAIITWVWGMRDTLPQLEFPAQVLGSGDATVFSVSCWLQYLRLVNPTNGNIFVSVQDRQSTPVYVIPPTNIFVSPPAGGYVLFESNYGDYCIGGVTVTCSAPGVQIYARGYYKA